MQKNSETYFKSHNLSNKFISVQKYSCSVAQNLFTVSQIFSNVAPEHGG